MHSTFNFDLCNIQVFAFDIQLFISSSQVFEFDLQVQWDVHSLFRIQHLAFIRLWALSGGAGSEFWNGVYMIAPVKKFGRVRLSTNFSSQQIWRRIQTWKDDEFLLGFTFSSIQTSINGSFGHKEA